MGSTAYTTRADASVLAYTSYDEWGKLKTPEHNGTNFAGVDDITDYTGHGYDRVLGKYFAQYRMYDAENKRFLAKDPYWNPGNMIYGDNPGAHPLPDLDAIMQSGNGYVYCLNDPVNNTDPLGLEKLYINGVAVANPWRDSTGGYYGGVTNLLEQMAKLGLITLKNNWKYWNPETKAAQYTIHIGDKIATLGFDAKRGIGYAICGDYFPTIKGCDFVLNASVSRFEVNLAVIKGIFDTLGIKFDSWEIREAGLVTSKMMSDFGWPVSDDELSVINAMLYRYGITDMRSIRLFMATCAHESSFGKDKLEKLNANGSVAGSGYSPNDRGAGYIQLTHRSTHLSFLNSVSDSFTGEKTAEYIANNYPWEAAGWFWSSTTAKAVSAEKLSLNDYVVKWGDSKGVYLITQYYVNGGWPSELKQADAEKIRSGTISWSVNSSNKLIVNGKDVGNAPTGWRTATTGRNATYDAAMKAFK